MIEAVNTVMTPAQVVRVPSEEEARIVEGIFLNTATGLKTVLFAAAHRRAGCTSMAVQVGRALAARVEGTVCLVDANFRSPALHKEFSLENERGLLQAIEGDGSIRDYAQRIDDSNLWVLPSGGAAESVASERACTLATDRLAELRREFDYVLIDSSALMESSDAALLGAATDGAIIVLAASATLREGTMKAKFALDAANVRVIGAILSKAVSRTVVHAADQFATRDALELQPRAA